MPKHHWWEAQASVFCNASQVILTKMQDGEALVFSPVFQTLMCQLLGGLAKMRFPTRLVSGAWNPIDLTSYRSLIKGCCCYWWPLDLLLRSKSLKSKQFPQWPNRTSTPGFSDWRTHILEPCHILPPIKLNPAYTEAWWMGRTLLYKSGDLGLCYRSSSAFDFGSCLLGLGFLLCNL